jgi:hypothetical protein
MTPGDEVPVSVAGKVVGYVHSGNRNAFGNRPCRDRIVHRYWGRGEIVVSGVVVTELPPLKRAPIREELVKQPTVRGRKSVRQIRGGTSAIAV